MDTIGFLDTDVQVLYYVPIATHGIDTLGIDSV